MARISEIHYSNAFARRSGEEEFLEVALDPDLDPADFTVSFYDASGALVAEIPLDDPNVQVTFDQDSQENVYVIQNGDFDIVFSDPDIPPDNNAEGIALTNTATGETLDFYDIGGGTSPIVATEGLAAGLTSENLPTPTRPFFADYSIQFNQPNPDLLTYGPLTKGNSGIICFVAGTLIETPDGLRPVEELQVGDLVTTKDAGPQPLRWVGRRTVPAEDRMAPVLIRKGTLGTTRDLRVSPQHRMLVTGWMAEMLFGVSEVLAPAAALVNDRTVVRQTGDMVSYHHILFDQHQLVCAEGAWSESFYPGPVGLATLERATRDEVMTLFPELQNRADACGPTVRPSLRHREGVLLAQDLLNRKTPMI